MSKQSVYPVSQEIWSKTLLTKEEYQAMYRYSVESPDEFWIEQAQRLKWIKPFSKVNDISFDKHDLHIRWYEDGVLNVSENCIDRHLEKRGNETAIIWEKEKESIGNKNETRAITYNELSSEVNRLANGLKSLGIQKGDIVTLYLPTVPEAAIAMLACARIGAIHSIVVSSCSAKALASRISDACQPEPMNAEDPLFILYASNSSENSKGVLHTTGGYLVYAAMTHEYVFNYQLSDVYMYGALCNGDTVVMPERDEYLSETRWWHIETNGAALPMLGIKPALIDESGSELTGVASGNLMIKDSWPGQIRTIYGDHQDFIDTYFSNSEGDFFTKKSARRDENGYYWLTT